MELDNRQPESFLDLPVIPQDLASAGFETTNKGNFQWVHNSDRIATFLNVSESGRVDEIWQISLNGRFRTNIVIGRKEQPDAKGVYYSAIVQLFDKPLADTEESRYDQYETQATNIRELSPLLKKIYFGIETRSAREESKLIFDLDDGQGEVYFGEIRMNEQEILPVRTGLQSQELLEKFLQEVEIDFQIDPETNDRVCVLYSPETDTEAVFIINPAIRPFRNGEEFIKHIQGQFPLFKLSARIKFLSNR